MWAQKSFGLSRSLGNMAICAKNFWNWFKFDYQYLQALVHWNEAILENMQKGQKLVDDHQYGDIMVSGNFWVER